MINKQAITDFLDRKLENWNWVKNVKEDALLEEVVATGIPYNPKTDPFLHQIAMALIAHYNDNFLFLLDMGLGKTKGILDILSMKKEQGKLTSALVLVPNAVTINSWENQIKEHSNLSYTGLYGKTEERLYTLLKGKSDIFITNYAGFQLMVMENTGKKGKRNPDYSKIDEIAKKVNACVLDEVHLCGNKNHDSLMFKINKYLLSKCRIKYALTGTPFGRNPHDLWAQFNMIDGGQTLGTTLGLFREAYFNATMNFFGGVDYKVKSHLKPLLYEHICNKSIRYEEGEVQDLPPKIITKKPIVLSEEAFRYYSSALTGCVEAGKNKLKIEGAFVRLRQITSGYFYMNKEGEEIYHKFKENPKMEMLLELLGSMPSGKKCVIFNDYIKTGELICENLTQQKIKHLRLFSGTKDKVGSIEKFLKDDSITALVANSASASVALNLQKANYCIFYESPVSPIVRAQAEKRCHRAGTSEKVFVYDLACINTIDERILSFILEGKNLFEEIINGRAGVSILTGKIDTSHKKASKK